MTTESLATPCIYRPVHHGHLLTSQTANIVGINFHYKIVIEMVGDGQDELVSLTVVIQFTIIRNLRDYCFSYPTYAF